MFNLGMGEITVILLLALLVIGPKGLPDLAATLGKLIRDFRKTAADVKKEIQIDDAVRKPFEELRDAITLSPDELQRRERIKREIANLQKKVEESEKETLAAAAATAAVEPAAPAPHHEGELPDKEGESARIAAAHAPTLPAPPVGAVAPSEPTPAGAPLAHPGGKTLPLGSAPGSTPSVPGLAVPVRAPEGTIARGASGRTILPPGESAPAAPASTPPAAGHLPGPPLPPSPFRRTSPRIAPLPGPSEGPVSRENATQVLVEADLMSGAGGPPPPPRATSTNRALPAPHPPAPLSPASSAEDDKTPV